MQPNQELLEMFPTLSNVMIYRVVMHLCCYEEMGRSEMIQQTHLLEDFQ